MIYKMTMVIGAVMLMGMVSVTAARPMASPFGIGDEVISPEPVVEVTATNTLWGVDENSGTLFSMGNYNDLANTTTLYGQLKWNDNGKIKEVGSQIDAFTIDTSGIAYMSVNKSFADYKNPVLIQFDLHQAQSGGDNIVTVIGAIDPFAKGSYKDITGLSFDPISNVLYGLYHDNGSSKADHLVTIDKTTGHILSEVGALEGVGEYVGNGQDLTFDPFGNLYVIDDRDDHLYQVDKNTAQILGIRDNDMGKNVEFQSLAWDAVANKLISTESNKNYFAELTLQNGNNNDLGSYKAVGLKDIEGIAFMPAGGAIPEPATLVLLGLAIPLLWRKKNRTPRSTSVC